MPWSNEISYGMEKSQCGSDPQKNDEQCVKNYRPVSLLPI